MNFLKTLPTAFLLVVLAGCATSLRGAPEPPFDPKLIEKAVFADPAALFTTLVEAKTKETRNLAIAKMVALVDIRYGVFRHNLAANRKHSGAISDVLLLGMDLAGGMSSAVADKDNLLGLSALLQGGETVFDKRYMYEQAMTALISQMDANRKTKLLEMRRAMSQSIDDYPGQLALADIVDYHHAGSLLGAVAGIQQAAAEQEEEAGRNLRELAVLTAAEIAVKRDESARLHDLAHDAGQRAKLVGFLTKKGIEISAEAPGPDEILNRLRDLRRDHYTADFEKLVAELETAGITVPE